MMTREELMALDKMKLVDMVLSLIANKGVCEANGECESKPADMMGGKMGGSCTGGMKSGGSCKGGAMPAAGSCKS